MRDDSDPLADLIELQPAWVKTFDLPGGDGAYWTIFPNSDSVEIRAEMIQPTVNLWSFGVWYWPEALAVVLALLVLVTGRWWWFARRGSEPRCRKCRYELTNLKSEACPECGTALTPRNRVTGLRSKWRMALAPVALLLIGIAWWFGEGHVPRHGWVSEKVQWHWAVHQRTTYQSRLGQRQPWFVLHGGELVSHVAIDTVREQYTHVDAPSAALDFPTLVSTKDLTARVFSITPYAGPDEVYVQSSRLTTRCRLAPPLPSWNRMLARFTTGPGPRDVNVFYIDGGQLILAVYELPEAE